MRNKHPFISACIILALTMHLMAQITPLWMTKSNGFTIQICAGQDVRTITIDENGNEIPGLPAPKTKNCAFCTAGTHNADLLKPGSSSFITLAYEQIHPFQETALSVKRIKASAHTARGPPQNT